MNHKTSIVVSVLLALPGVLRAEVTISEIAWMGSNANANAEWIELHNTGDTVSLEGWTLSAADGQPNIALTGTLSAQGFFLLERTSDDTVPGVPAGVLYTGAMGNTGEVFELKDVSGTVVDRVDGSGDWGVGGDNTAKLTLQRSGVGWVTAVATPGAQNASSNDTAYQAAADGVSSSAENASSRTKKPVMTGSSKKETPAPAATALLEPALSIDIGEERTVATGARHPFVADVRKEGGKPIELNTLVWNFGDGTTGEGMRVVHAYPYPGEYVVRVRATRNTFKPAMIAEDTTIVQVIPLTLTVSHADRDSIELTNASEHDVDLSRFALAAGNSYFRIPQDTILLQDARIRFSSRTTKLVVDNPQSVGIFTPDGVRVAQFSADDIEQGMSLDSEEEDEELEEVVSDVLLLDEESVEEGEEVAVVPEGGTSTLPATLGLVERAAQERDEKTSLVWWFLGLIALAGTTGSVIVLARRERAEIIEGFVIESEDE